MSRKLNKRDVDTLKHSKGAPSQNILWDGGSGGVASFGVRVRATGKKYFFIKYRTKANRQRWYTIGKYGAPWTVEAARKKATHILAEVEDGKDPLAQKELEKGIPTLEKFCDSYLTDVKNGTVLTKSGRPKRKTTIATDEIRIKNYIKPLLGKIRLDAITERDIVKFRDQVKSGKGLPGSKSSGGPGASARTLGLLSGILSEAKRQKYIDKNPAIGVTRPRGETRERYLTTEEFKAIGDVLVRAENKKLEGFYTISAIRLLIFTGCRKSEILTLKWADVDFSRAMLFLKEAKTDNRFVYLNVPAIEILKSVPKIRGNPYVLCGGKEGQHLVNITKAWQRLRKAAGLEDVRLHDLRHSYASIGAGGGVPLQIIGKLLGHTQTTTTERYAHLANDPVKAANEAMAKEIQAAMLGKGENSGRAK